MARLPAKRSNQETRAIQRLEYRRSGMRTGSNVVDAKPFAASADPGLGGSVLRCEFEALAHKATFGSSIVDVDTRNVRCQGMGICIQGRRKPEARLMRTAIQ